MKFYDLGEQGLVAGCDEAGSGPAIGAVYAAAVIFPQNSEELFPKDSLFWQIKDSKKLSHKKKEILIAFIEENALSYCVASVDEKEIDKINILNARILAMHRALDGLSKTPDHIIVDGDKFKIYKGITHECIKEGDNIYFCIAAASILAKCYRDEYVINVLHPQYPQYKWDKNKGYLTKEHIQAIKEYGKNEFYRMSFKITGIDR